MKNQKNVLLLAEIAVLTALAIVFDYIANLFSFTLFPNGGSVSIAMLPVFILALRRGLIPGIVSGLLLGFIQTIIAPPYFAPLNPALGYFLDYPIGYGVVGLAGLTRKLVQSKDLLIGSLGVIFGVLIGGLMRTLIVTISGVYCWTSSWVASIVYNFPYMLPSILISGILAYLIYLTARIVYVVD